MFAPSSPAAPARRCRSRWPTAVGSTRNPQPPKARSWWATPWDQRHTYYIDAISGQNRIAAIFAEIDLWGCESLHLDPPSRQPAKPSFTIDCRCGYTGQVRGYPHDECGEPFCPHCGACGCDRKYAKHKPCKKCFVTTPPNDLIDGVCSMCR